MGTTVWDGHARRNNVRFREGNLSSRMSPTRRLLPVCSILEDDIRLYEGSNRFDSGDRFALVLSSHQVVSEASQKRL